jgi:hypothetical protein
MVNWKTTTTGIATILVAVGSTLKALTDNDPATVPDYTVLVAAITSGLGLIFARDYNKSSEDTGIAVPVVVAPVKTPDPEPTKPS